jgi:hypothetical protein
LNQEQEQEQEQVSRCNSNELVAECQFPLIANSKKPIADTNHKTGFQQKMQENYQP